MRARALFVLIAAALVSGISCANAQGNWFGIRSGYPLGVTLHYGVANGFGPGADLRVSGRLVVDQNGSRFGLGLDAMHTVAAASPFSVYLGGGPAVEFGSGVALLDVHGLVGSEFRFVDLGMPQLGLFAEGTLGARIGISGISSRFPTFGAALGVNYHF
jgi:hypothetical protein